MRNYVSISFMAILLCCSCATRKQMIYLQDMDETVDYPVTMKYESKIQRDDKLNIVVTCKNPELALAFNLPGYGSYSVSEDGKVRENSNPASRSNSKEVSYSVDVNGNIDFPVLGILHVEGLTRNQIRDMIKKKLVEQGYIMDPVVFVDFMNFKFSVLGEVNSVGTYNIDGDKITILEALAQAGDLKESARIDHISVFREFGNSRRVIHLDLRSKDIFLSPAYYLQQNDIVYAEPNEYVARRRNRENISYWASGISILSSITAFILYLLK